MTEPTKRPTGAAVAAALSPFVGLPLTFAFFILAVGRGDEFGGGPLQGLSQAWMEGGWGMYLVLGAGGFLAVVTAVLMFFGIHRGSVAVLAGAPVASTLVAVGGFASWRSMNQVVEAIAMVSPVDRATILAAGTSESLTTTLLGLCAMAGLLSAGCLGTLLGVLAQQGVARRLLLSATGVFGSLVALAGAFALRLHELMGGFKALAHVSPEDRSTLLAGIATDLERHRFVLIGALVLVLVMVVVGALLVKDTPRFAVLVPLLGLAGLYGFGVQALARSSVDGTSARTAPASLGLLDLPGSSTMAPRWCVHGTSVVECDEGGFGSTADAEALEDELGANLRQVQALHEVAGDETREASAYVGLAKDASAETTWSFLRHARRAGFSQATLVGETTQERKVELPSELRFLARAIETRFRGVLVGLRTVDEGCAACSPATVKGESLVVGAETWSPAPFTGDVADLRESVSIEANTALSPKTLTQLALAAASHHQLLVVLLPADGDASDQKKGRELLEKVFGEGAEPVPTFGGLGSHDEADADEPGLAKEQIAATVKKHLAEMRFCYEQALTKNPTLEGKVVLRWVIKPNGTVANVSVKEDTLKDAGAVKCMSARPAKWQFPKPSTKGEVVVSYPFSFKTAQ